ncbi:MAG TPA: cytochrome c [Bryobacterales bacterium]|nr:cytochrome c [Bryobacterales bacterium]
MRGRIGARCLLLFSLGAGLCRAHDPITTKITWTREISRIFYRRCFACHGKEGPSMPLLTYEQTRPWAKAIKEAVLERRMPPWGPVKGFGGFKNDASLSEVEIELIVNWVEGGAPEGELMYLAPPPDFIPKPPDPPPAEPVPIKGLVRLDREVTAIGVEPSGSVQATAHIPGGGIAPLIWIRDFRPGQPKTYYFREALKLPKGTEIRCEGAAARLLIAASQPAQ